MQFDVPILFLLFNRPDLARQVLNRIRQIQPRELFVSIDGPRPNHPTDAEQVAQSIALLDEIDWPCQVHRLIQDQNLGCRQAVSTAITWFFEQVEMGIILEDDCLPDPSFFTFCRENLHHHRDNATVMHIGGVNFQNGQWHGDGSYFYTKICHVWGWASWRRAWEKYDVSMDSYPVFRKQNRIADLFSDPKVQEFWIEAFDSVASGRVSSWAYPWVYTIWINNGLCIYPNRNLITNIGFGGDATHTRDDNDSLANQPLQAITEVKHPAFLIENVQATDYSANNYFKKPGWMAIKTESLKRRLGLKN
ncbi:nucleotide-diphospho-sugar transferase [Larkinella insperata]|uniref:Nucleotide-diphospho-sugar transferase n=1 Tax=Larkinella insperata TaxID=332158 RepID=A0ABW3QBZ7_9BACT|nr:nucleotide-diphospho-sugar transferase [Larkinella insperata]